MDFEQWKNFNKNGEWTKEIDVRSFIQANYKPYTGDATFLADATEKTKTLWNEVLELYKKERENGGVLDADVKTPSTINGYDAGYIDKDLEDIVGLQTDKPLKRAIMPNGGIRIVEKSAESYGFKVIDLGKNVPAEEVLRVAREQEITLVGLSALMTTTVKSMEKTIMLIRESGLNIKVMVGGAVLTEEYAKSIGADFYAKDAMESVKIAENHFLAK